MNNLKKYNLIKDYRDNRGVIVRLKHNKHITTRTICDICNKLDIKLDELLTYTKDTNNN